MNVLRTILMAFPCVADQDASDECCMINYLWMQVALKVGTPMSFAEKHSANNDLCFARKILKILVCVFWSFIRNLKLKCAYFGCFGAINPTFNVKSRLVYGGPIDIDTVHRYGQSRIGYVYSLGLERPSVPVDDPENNFLCIFGVLDGIERWNFVTKNKSGLAPLFIQLLHKNDDRNHAGKKSCPSASRAYPFSQRIVVLANVSNNIGKTINRNRCRPRVGHNINRNDRSYATRIKPLNSIHSQFPRSFVDLTAAAELCKVAA